MAKDYKKPNAPPEPESPHQFTQQEFVDEYNALCKKTGWNIIGQAIPQSMTIGNASGAFVSVQLGIAPYQEPPKQ